MRDRLSQLIFNKLSETCSECSSFECTEELTDYLLEKGVIVPPCKVGDKLYWINRVSEEVETDRVISLHLYETKFVITTETLGRKSITTYDWNRLLEIMYFTKEEAEAAMKGGAER
jgi:hypothetical protein